MIERERMARVSDDIAGTVICLYRPRAEALGEFLGLVRSHRAVLLAHGLAAPGPETLYVGQDQDSSGPLVVSIFRWRDDDAASSAHANPEVGALWSRMEALVEDRAMGPGMSFPHFASREEI